VTHSRRPSTTPKAARTTAIDLDKTELDARGGIARRGSDKCHACLVVIYGPDLGHRMTLSRGAFEIGRSSKCDLPIDQESVSRRHARITFSGGAHHIEDLGSTNGTYIAEQRVDSRHPLQHGDQIRLGRSILKYMAGDDLETNYHEEIYRLMTVDALTQTHNKRYFNEVFERELHRSLRYHRDLSLVLFDIDHFKVVNDTHGHVGGDAVLRQIAQSIHGRLRGQDIFARVGGEEFAILLPEVPLAGARVTAEKVRRIVEGASIVYETATIACTVSAGVATLEEALAARGGGATGGDEARGASEALLKLADDRLYEAKRTGRNRTVG
jgi:diguanylate cyclase (GGDEF)-like protein